MNISPLFPSSPFSITPSLIQDSRSKLLVSCVALAIIMAGAAYWTYSRFWKENHVKQLDLLPTTDEFGPILEEEEDLRILSDSSESVEESERTHGQGSSSPQALKTNRAAQIINAPFLPQEKSEPEVVEDPTDSVHFNEDTEEAANQHALIRQRAELYAGTQNVLGFLFQGTKIETNQMEEHLLEFSGEIPPSEELIKAQKIVHALLEEQAANSTLTQEEMANFWTIVCLASFPYFPDFVIKLDQCLMTELEYADQCLKRVMELMGGQFQSFLSASHDPNLLLYGNALSAFFDLFTKGPQADLDTLKKRYQPSLNQIEALQLERYRQDYQIDFLNLEDAMNYAFKEQFLSFLEERIQHKNEPDFLKTTQEMMIRRSYQDIFHECIIDDILDDLNVENSAVLEMVDLILIDFISLQREGVWFHDAQQNFGYAKQEQEWKLLLVENPADQGIDGIPEKSTFLKEVVSAYVDHFEDCLDLFYAYKQQSYPFIQDLQFLIDHLQTVLNLPLDIHRLWEGQITRPVADSEDHVIYSRIFQKAFLKWSLTELRLKYPDEVKEIQRELDLRILMSDMLIRHPGLSIVIQDQSRNKIAVELQKLMFDGLHAAKCSSRNLIQSRSSSGKKRDLTLGFGFQGTFFHPSPQLKSDDERIFLNLSETGRRLPIKQTQAAYDASLFSIPFLHAARFLMQQKRRAFSETGDPSEASDLVNTKILNHPSEEDKQVHRYLFDRILFHALTNPDVVVHADFLPKMKEEILQNMTKFIPVETNRIVKISKNRAQSKTDTESELANLQKLERQIRDKINTQDRPLFDPDEFCLIQKVLTNKQSICVESVITRHSKNHLIVPLSFNPNRPDTIVVDGKKLQIGKHARPVIPPCDNYCQLFSASHLIWAELTRHTSLDELDAVAKDQGKSGVHPQF